MNIIYVDNTLSTNTLMAETDRATPLPHATVIAARQQTAGRGQRGNSWEAAPGKNITMSMMLRPKGVCAAEQFAISEAVASGVARAIERAMDNRVKITVKWPNDIYAGDMKICGILIENSLAGTTITRSIAGIGINVNQTEWLSDAPNPVSMAQLTGATYPIEQLISSVTSEIESLIPLTSTPEGRTKLHTLYMERLWRRSGYHLWQEPQSAEPFPARIAHIALTGHLTLETAEGLRRTYAFKEISAVIKSPSTL